MIRKLRRRNEIGSTQGESREPRTAAFRLLGYPVRAFAVMTGFGLGVVQFASPRETLPHRTIGWIWVALLLVASVSALFVHEIRLWGPWSPIHLLAIFTLAVLPIAVWNAHRHKVQTHRNNMVGLFVGALVIAGVFTFLPGRIMHAVAFGP